MPPTSRRRSKWRAVAACSWTTKDAGADAADRELLVALDLQPLALHLGDPRGGRSLAKEGDQLLDRLLGALGVDPHRAVLVVSNPAHDPEPARLRARRFAEADPLHIAADDGAEGYPLFVRASHSSSLRVFFGVLVDLVLAHLSPGDAAPDHVAVVVDAAVLGVVEVDVAADADRLPPGEPLEHHLVRIDLQADVDEAREPPFQLRFAGGPRRERAVPRKDEPDVLGVHRHRGAGVPGPDRLHVAGDHLSCQPREHRASLR